MRVDIRASTALKAAADTLRDDEDTDGDTFSREQVLAFLDGVTGVILSLERQAGITDETDYAQMDFTEDQVYAAYIQTGLVKA